MPEAVPLLAEEAFAAEAIPAVVEAAAPAAAAGALDTAAFEGLTAADAAAAAGTAGAAEAAAAAPAAAGTAADVASAAAPAVASGALDTGGFAGLTPADVSVAPATTAAVPEIPSAPAISTAPAPADIPVDETSQVATTPQGTTTAPSGATQPDVQYQSAPTPVSDAFSTGADKITKALQSLGITSPEGGLGKNAFPAASLGLNVASQARAQKMQQSLQEQLQKQADITAPAATKLMDQFQQGTIGASQQKLIDDYKAQQKAQIKQRYARMGRDPNYDSAAQQEMANVDIQAASMTDAALQNVLSSGLKAAGVTAGPAQQAILAGYNADQNAQKQQQEFLKTLAEMQATAGTGTPSTPAVPA